MYSVVPNTEKRQICEVRSSIFVQKILTVIICRYNGGSLRKNKKWRKESDPKDNPLRHDLKCFNYSFFLLKPPLAIANDSLPIPTIEVIFNGNSSRTCVKLRKNRKLKPVE